MNWDQIQGNWLEFKGAVRERWAKLTDNDLEMIQGRYEQLAGRLQELYGIAREEAERQIQDFSSLLDRSEREARVERRSKRARA